MRDVLLRCLIARGCAQGDVSNRCTWTSRGTTILGAAEVMKWMHRTTADKWGMFFRLRLHRVGSAQPLIAMDQERPAANAGWNQLR